MTHFLREYPDPIYFTDGPTSLNKPEHDSIPVNTQAAQARDERISYVNETYANVTLAFERCCVTKMRFTRVCMGTLRVCFKYLKSNVL